MPPSLDSIREISFPQWYLNTRSIPNISKPSCIAFHLVSALMVFIPGASPPLVILWFFSYPLPLVVYVVWYTMCLTFLFVWLEVFLFIPFIITNFIRHCSLILLQKSLFPTLLIIKLAYLQMLLTPMFTSSLGWRLALNCTSEASNSSSIRCINHRSGHLLYLVQNRTAYTRASTIVS